MALDLFKKNNYQTLVWRSFNFLARIALTRDDTYQSVYVDEITVDIPPTCPKPTDLYTANPTQTSIDLGWTEAATATTWHIEYAEAGFEPTRVPDIITEDNPYELTGLIAGTDYEFYIQAFCGEGDSSYWVGPYYFVTLCDAMELPLTEDFDDVITPDIPLCWSSIVNSSTTWSMVETSDWNVYSVPNCMRFTNGNDTESVNILTLPEVDKNIEDVYLIFVADGGVTMSLGTISDPLDETTYSEWSSYTTFSDNYEEFEIYFTGYTGTDEFIAIKAKWSQTYQNLYLDDLLNLPPSCPKTSDPFLIGFNHQDFSL